jgi:hypothetical protein
MGTVMAAVPTPEQAAVCRRWGVEPQPPEPGMKVGISRTVLGDIHPLNGMRHPPEGDTTGWYIWAGEELSSEADFFVPLHVEHVSDWTPNVIPYLALPPGWRFLLAQGHVDAWFDQSLLSHVDG